MIRKATLEDVPILIAIGSLFHSQTVLSDLLPYDSESVRHLLVTSIENDACAVFVLEDKGKVVGGICGAVVPMYWNNRLLVGQQFAWFVVPSKREGIKSLGLLDEFERWAFEEKDAVACFSGRKQDENAKAMGRLLSGKGYFELESMHLKMKEVWSCQQYQQ
jgi:hypothetical protein